MNKIFIIEQDGEQQTVSIANFLTDSGYEVIETRNVLRAAAILQRTKFDLILCSQKLFDEDRSPLRSIILENERYTKIILLREAGEKKSEATQHERIVGNLEKPVDQKKLLELISSKVHKSGFTGMVNDIDITDYLQLLAMNKVTKAFVVKSMKRSGIMVLHRGELIYVAYGELRGELAFHALLSLQHGTITDKKLKRIPQKNIRKSLTRLLLENATSSDESNVQPGADFLFEETTFLESESIGRMNTPEHVPKGTWQKHLFLCMAFLVFYGLLGGIVWKSFSPHEVNGIYRSAQIPIEVPLSEFPSPPSQTATKSLTATLKNFLFAQTLHHSKIKNVHISNICCAF